MSTAILRLHRCPFPVSCISIEEFFLVSPKKSNDKIRSTCETAAKHCGSIDKNLQRIGAQLVPTSVRHPLPYIMRCHCVPLALDSLFGVPHIPRQNCDGPHISRKFGLT